MNTGRMLFPLLTLVPGGILAMLFLPDYAELGFGVMLAGQIAFIIIAALEVRRADRREGQRIERERQGREGASPRD